MVFYFTSEVVSPAYHLYMGEDKHENELLIKYHWPEDVWFHVDKLSSAHVYLRMRQGETIEDIPQLVIDDCCQLVKANSIEGCKAHGVDIVYTLASNLKKTGDMAVGQVSFHKEKDVHKVKHCEKKPDIVKRLNKTKVEDKTPDFQKMKDERDRQEREAIKKRLKEEERQAKQQKEEQDRFKEERSYDRLFKPENMTSNYEKIDEDDFM